TRPGWGPTGFRKTPRSSSPRNCSGCWPNSPRRKEALGDPEARPPPDPRRPAASGDAGRVVAAPKDDCYEQAHDPTALINQRGGHRPTPWTQDLQAALAAALQRRPTHFGYQALEWTVPLLQERPRCDERGIDSVLQNTVSALSACETICSERTLVKGKSPS